jgi:hypothetical protein
MTQENISAQEEQYQAKRIAEIANLQQWTLSPYILNIGSLIAMGGGIGLGFLAKTEDVSKTLNISEDSVTGIAASLVILTVVMFIYDRYKNYKEAKASNELLHPDPKLGYSAMTAKEIDLAASAKRSGNNNSSASDIELTSLPSMNGSSNS